jgi:dehydrogenase/reductase SDR family protein 12
MSLADIMDAVLEAPVAPSFSRIGYALRRRLSDWRPLDSYDLSGRTVVLTGATSGLGLAAARQMVACNARVIAIGRNPEKTARVAAEIGAEPLVVDMSDLDSVRAAADHLADEHIDVLVHNAGALDAERHESPQGIEQTIACHVIGPFLLTTLLLDQLGGSAPGRVLTMASGGLYSAGLPTHLQLDAASYDGVKQYAIAKRAQVTLNALWASRVSPQKAVFHALHPGWADTPGVVKSLPRFHKIVGPFLRTPAEGADTLVWLAADDEAVQTTSGFWHDRRTRALHRSPGTRATDTPERRQALWDEVATLAGVD